jgi:hypothetical protein
VPLAVEALVMVGAAVVLLIVKANFAVPVPLAPVALIVTLDTPTAVGVPEMTPVFVLTESPGGNTAALKLVGLLVAVIA